MALVRVRYEPGAVGETKRVVHLTECEAFEAAMLSPEAEEVAALCGEQLRIIALDVILGMAGAPCFGCLQKTPRGDGVPEQRPIAANGPAAMNVNMWDDGDALGALVDGRAKVTAEQLKTADLASLT